MNQSITAREVLALANSLIDRNPLQEVVLQLQKDRKLVPESKNHTDSLLTSNYWQGFHLLHATEICAVKRNNYERNRAEWFTVTNIKNVWACILFFGKVRNRNKVVCY